MTQPVHVVAAVIFRTHDSEKKILTVRRGPDQSGAGAWEFPGGKVEAGESPIQALKREIEEELGLSVHVRDYIGEVVHDYPAKSIRLSVYWAETEKEELVLVDHDAFKWSLPEEIQSADLSAADRPFLEKLIHGKR